MIRDSEIVATVRYGRFIGSKKIWQLYFLAVVSCFMPVVTLGIVITVAFQVMTLDNEIIFTLIVLNILALLLFSVSVWLILYHKRRAKEIREWLKDAVRLEAKVKEPDNTSDKYEPHRVQVVFTFCGKKIVHTSKPNRILGYHNMLAGYVGRTIKILYSPTYDQVMILRNSVK